jgi:DNA mismatch repair ATPase MutS
VGSCGGLVLQNTFQLRPGAAPNGSCGIAVAAVAGLPAGVVDRARAVAAAMEGAHGCRAAAARQDVSPRAGGSAALAGCGAAAHYDARQVDEQAGVAAVAGVEQAGRMQVEGWQQEFDDEEDW